MSQFPCRIVLDSVNDCGARITTMEMTGWLPTHAEFMTHRMFSRNAASSRAIPAKRMRDMVENSPILPVRWPGEQKGMQGGSNLGEDAEAWAKKIWDKARMAALEAHSELTDPDGLAWLHKSVANRLLIPWLGITKVVTATNAGWSNYFNLRCHHMAQDEEQEQAFNAAEEYFNSAPVECHRGDWHLPYLLQSEQCEDPLSRIKWSSSRCARVSYVRQNEVDHAAEEAIFNRLLQSSAEDNPIHASPFEHIAQNMGNTESYSNLTGWMPYRSQVFRNFCNEFTKEDLERRKSRRIEEQAQ